MNFGDFAFAERIEIHTENDAGSIHQQEVVVVLAITSMSRCDFVIRELLPEILVPCILVHAGTEQGEEEDCCCLFHFDWWYSRFRRVEISIAFG